MSVLLQMTEKSKKIYYAYVIFLAVAGVILAIYITLPYGAGVSSDAMRNLAVSENVLNGKGFFDDIGNPFLWWPPLYPLILVFLSFVTRLDVFIVGWVLNVVLFGVNIWLFGLLFERIFVEKIIFAYLNSFVVFLSLPLLKISTNIASDPLFITFIMLWLILWGDWDGKSNSRLFWLTVVAALAVSQRLLGCILIGVGGLLILNKFRSELRKGFLLAGVFGIGSVAPVAAWFIGHNYLQYHTLFGSRIYEQMVPWKNFLSSIGKVLDWFYPYYLVESLFRYWFLGFILLGIILLLINRKDNWLDWLKSITGRYVGPGLIFSAIYFSVLMFTIDSFDQKSIISDRYQVVILFSLLAIISISFDKLILSHFDITPRKLSFFLITAFAVWSLYPLHNLNKYITRSRAEGESTYNLYNTRSFNESPTLSEVKKIIAREPDANLYSNIPGAVWFSTRHMLIEMPAERHWKKDVFKEKMAGWPHDKAGYIIWFEPDPFEIYYPPRDLALVANLKIISKTSDGVIFYVTPQAQH